MKIWLALLISTLLIVGVGWVAFTTVVVSLYEPVPVYFPLDDTVHEAPVSLSFEADAVAGPALFIAGELRPAQPAVGEAVEYNVFHRISGDNINLMVN